MANKLIIYLSGHTTLLSKWTKANIGRERDWVTRTGCTHRCFSFAHCCPGSFYYTAQADRSLRVFVKDGGRVMMDSGGYSFHKFMEGSSGKISASKKRTFATADQFREQTIEMYVKWCREHGTEWDWYANFDYLRHCPTIYATQKRLEGLGLHPTPIYHGDSGIEWMKRYIDEGHTYIGIARAPQFLHWKMGKRYLDRCHDLAAKHNIKLHGFGMTSFAQMVMWPWHSVDSTSWNVAARYGLLYFWDAERAGMGLLHVSSRELTSSKRSSFRDLPKATQKEIRTQVEGLGFDMEKLRNELRERLVYNAYMFTHFSDFLGDSNHSRERWELLV